MPIRITGLNSGLDTETIISALVSSYNYKTEKYKKAQTKLSWKQEAWQTLNTKIYSFYNSVGNLRYSTSYNLKSTTVSDSTKATVTAGSSAPNGTQRLNITQIAQAGYLTGGKLASGTTTGTTLAELGYTGGDGKITVTKGDGTTKEISVSQGTTVSSFITSLKNAGLTASYDTTNNRIYVSSKDTGAANDFTLTGANVDGANALYALGLNVDSSATSATYTSYTKYYDATSGKTIEENVESGIEAYKNAKAAYEKASAQNANMVASYGYASAYSAMMDTLNKVTDGTDRQKLRTLLEMTASQRVNSVMDADGKVYTKTGTDDDGNTIYSYGEGADKKYIKSIVTYADTDGNTYKLNDDKTLTYDNKTYTSTGKKDDNGDLIYKDEDGNTVSIKTTTEYYNATAKEEETGFYKYTDAEGNTYTENDTHTYAGSNGKTYRLDGTSLIEVDADGNDVTDGHKVEDVTLTEITKTVYEGDGVNSKIKRSSDVLTDIKEKEKAVLTDDVIKTLTSNISTVNTFEKTADTLDDTDPYSRAGIAAAMKSVYETGSYTYYDAENKKDVTVDFKDDKGNLITGAAAVNKLVNTYADKIAANKTTMADSQTTMDEHSALAKIAAMEDDAGDVTAKSDAIDAFVKQVQEVLEITADPKYNTDAKKIDGQDAIIKLNGVEYTNATNAFSINGLNIVAQAETGDDEDDAISITTQTDVQGIYDKIKDFLTQYNALINEITSLYNADSAKGYEPLTDDEKDAMSDTEIEKWEEKIKSALLRRDDSLESVMNSMTSAMSKGIKIDGKTYYLSNFGINTLGYLNAAENEQYAYHINGDEDDSATSGKADKLMAAITNDPDTVIEFMQNLCIGLYDAVGDKMKSTTLSSVYKVYNDKEMASEYSDYTDLIKKWEEKLEEKEDYWYNKFSSMETALSKLNSQSSSLSSLLGG